MAGSGKWTGAAAVALLCLALGGCSNNGAPTTAAASTAAARPTAKTAEGIDEVVIAAPMAAVFACSEHPLGQLSELGDALGADCFVIRQTDSFPTTHEGDGKANEDWFGWRQPLLAPFDAVVERVRVNPITNHPGRLGKPPASAITFRRADGVHVTYAHVQETVVAEGDTVTTGQPVARVGNNGMAWMPHVHVGAWRGTTPLQVRIDLASLGRLQGHVR
jgi:murein DD-endopeptidase MepM/ murein hydrolase activator NlpD